MLKQGASDGSNNLCLLKANFIKAGIPLSCSTRSRSLTWLRVHAWAGLLQHPVSPNLSWTAERLWGQS